MKKNKSDRKRIQASKGRNAEFARATREEHAAAARPMRNKAKYSRTDRRDQSWKAGY